MRGEIENVHEEKKRKEMKWNEKKWHWMDLKIYENRECEYKIRRNKNKFKKELVSMEVKYKQREKDEIIVSTF